MSTNTWCMSFVQHKTCPALPDDVTIMIHNQLWYKTLDLNQLECHTHMRSRIWDDKNCVSPRGFECRHFRFKFYWHTCLSLLCVTFFCSNGHARIGGRVWVCITAAELSISFYWCCIFVKIFSSSWPICNVTATVIIAYPSKLICNFFSNLRRCSDVADSSKIIGDDVMTKVRRHSNIVATSCAHWPVKSHIPCIPWGPYNCPCIVVFP